MSSSPVELLDGWRLNHTKGLSLFATSDDEPFLSDEPELPDELLSGLEPHAASERLRTVTIAIEIIFFFILISPFSFTLCTCSLLILTVYPVL